MQTGPRILLLIVSLALLVGLGPRATVAQPTPHAASDPWAHAHVPTDLLVSFRSGQFARRGAAAPSVSASLDRYLSAFGVQTATDALDSEPVYRLRFPQGTDLAAKQRELLADPNVAFAEPNYLLSADLLPNDPFYAQQYALPKIGADRIWDITTGITGSPVIVAMLDTGISRTHPDLAGRVLQGYDFVHNDPDPGDDNGHGTFTAGVVGAGGNNGVGVAGMDWGARLMPVKILNSEGLGEVATFAQGIRYAVDNGAQIVNVSAGITVPSQTMEAAVRYATGQGVIVVAASGNVADGVQNYPAAYPDVIAVSASTQSDDIADFSSYGSYVWVAAPGDDIVSTFYRDGDTYAKLKGTSASAPFVTGTIALMLSQRKGLSLKTVREALKATAVDIGAAGFDPKSGFGRLDAYHALLVATAPDPTLSGARVTPASGKGGDSFVLAAAGFTANEPIALWLSLPDGSYRYYRYPPTYSNAGGQLLATLSTPDPLPAGVIRVTAYGETSRRVAATTFEVTQPATAQAFNRVPPTPDTDTRVYFAATGHTLGNGFLAYWRANGGLPIFGYPISEEFTERSPIDGKDYTVQYFERNRFEYHPENKGTPYEVLLGLLGRDLTLGRVFATAPPPFESTPARAYFAATGHSLSGEFLTYWLDNGGLAIFGYPLSEPFVEVSPTDGKPYLVQYFERNRFELHPENQPPYNVLLGLLGTDSARLKGYIAR